MNFDGELLSSFGRSFPFVLVLNIGKKLVELKYLNGGAPSFMHFLNFSVKDCPVRQRLKLLLS